MHLIVDENLTAEQLASPRRYIYELCEMYGWEFPEDVFALKDGYAIMYNDVSLGKARKRQRLIRDACIRLGTKVVKDGITVNEVDCYTTASVIPYYKAVS